MYPTETHHHRRGVRPRRGPLSTLSILILGAGCLVGAGFATAPPEPYEIATWRGFRASAVSYTFDDNSPKQFSVAQPMLDARGLPATFFCIVGNLSDDQWAVIENASAKGHEIGSHTLTHPDLSKLTGAEVDHEESESKALIESHTGKACVSLAYPYCTVPEELITSQHYPFARSCNGSLVPDSPANFLRVGALGPEGEMNAASDTAAESGSWLVWLLHGIDDDPACCPIDSHDLEVNLDHVAAEPGKWWVDTFGNVCRYIQERDAAVLAVVADEGNRITLRLTHDLDNTVFNTPLSLRRPMPDGWATAAVSQDGVPVPSRVVEGKLVFDAVPNGGDIVISQQESPVSPLPTPTYGWNLGNTLEPPSGEGTWGPVATQALINSVADSGFNTVRLPVAWDSHANQTTHEIDPAWMARVKEVVDWCYAKNLHVVLNCHWDGGWLENHITDTVDPVIDAKMAAYWTQIATAFKDYDDRLLFAGANEPDCETPETWATLMTYYETFIRAVRETGANNVSRWLVIQGPKTNYELTDELVTAMPDDSTPGRLMLEVHHYTPYPFTIMQEDEWWGNRAYFWGQDYHHPTRTDRNATFDEEEATDALFQLMADRFVSQGIPVIVGEFQAMKRSGQSDLTGADYDLHVASRTYFHKYIVQSANRHGLKPIYWDIAGQLFDWTTGAVTDPDNLRVLTGGPALLPSGEVEEIPSTVPAYGWAPFTIGAAGTWTPTGVWVESGLQFSASDLPAWASIDPASGVVSGTPPAGAVGTFTPVTISVWSGAQALGEMTLNLVVAAPGSDLAPVNQATRGRVGWGDQTLATGFVVGGDSPRSFLIRAVGPTIGAAPYHVGGVLADPVLSVFNQQGAVLRQNDDWGDSADRAALAAAFSTAGAFELAEGGKDAALLVTLDPGLYTAQASGADEGTGVALVEFYDVTDGDSAGTLLNVSSRAQVGTGEAVLIPGLVLRGGGTKRLLVRAIGPTLEQYDVSGVLANPQMTLIKDGQVLATNDDWAVGTDAAEIEAVSSTVGAFALPAQSHDAVLLATLAEGAYSVVLRGVGDTSGIALLEVYLVP